MITPRWDLAFCSGTEQRSGLHPALCLHSEVRGTSPDLVDLFYLEPGTGLSQRRHGPVKNPSHFFDRDMTKGSVVDATLLVYCI